MTFQYCCRALIRRAFSGDQRGGLLSTSWGSGGLLPWNPEAPDFISWKLIPLYITFAFLVMSPAYQFKGCMILSNFYLCPTQPLGEYSQPTAVLMCHSLALNNPQCPPIVHRTAEHPSASLTLPTSYHFPTLVWAITLLIPKYLLEFSATLHLLMLFPLCSLIQQIFIEKLSSVLELH